MCGIFAYVIFKGGIGSCSKCGCICSTRGVTKNIDLRRQEFLDYSRKMRHRGPDWTGNFSDTREKLSIFMVHERLSIIDPFGGSQPLIYTGPTGERIVLCANGEIFNYKELRAQYPDFPYQTNNDCEVILALYLKHRDDLHQITDLLDGQFSFVVYDSERESIFAARDPIGITSFYYGKNAKDGSMAFASELKGIPKEFKMVELFPPGHYMHVKDDVTTGVTLFDYFSNSKVGTWKKKYLSSEKVSFIDYLKTDEETICANIREVMTQAVKKRLMTDVPFGMLLSGGLDSSLVCSIAVRLIKNQLTDIPWQDKIFTFSIGLEGSPDLEKALEVANFLGTCHYSFVYTIQEGLDAIHDVIYQLETYETSLIRSSTPMSLLSRKIKSTGVKMVLSGEGSDEVFGGYLYFLNAPNNEEFNRESCKRTCNLHKFECMRADKSTMSWGVEGRFPYLDKYLMDYSIDLDPELKKKNGIEKYILRKAFDLKDETTQKEMYLPNSVLWRQKEQFSDGVGYNWIDTLESTANSKYTDEEFIALKNKYVVNPPATKEALYYREIFESFYPNRAELVEYWVPRTDWPGVSANVSGRAQASHKKALN